MKSFFVLCVFLVFVLHSGKAQDSKLAKQKSRTVSVDKKGIIRWNNGDEVGLFGANYSLPSACDFRAAGKVSNDRKKLVDQDMTHFARMGWDGMRLCLWG